MLLLVEVCLELLVLGTSSADGTLPLIRPTQWRRRRGGRHGRACSSGGRGGWRWRGVWWEVRRGKRGAARGSSKLAGGCSKVSGGPVARAYGPAGGRGGAATAGGSRRHRQPQIASAGAGVKLHLLLLLVVVAVVVAVVVRMVVMRLFCRACGSSS